VAAFLVGAVVLRIRPVPSEEEEEYDETEDVAAVPGLAGD
jgi:hypothetical protein